jgi:hypothetical protein
MLEKPGDGGIPAWAGGESITPGRGGGQAQIIEMAAENAVENAIGRDDAGQAMTHTMPERVLLARRNSKPDLIQKRCWIR